MIAINRINENNKFSSRNDFLKQKIKCVFISYQNNDKQHAKKIANYLLKAGINVYFDEYDSDLKLSNQSKNPSEVTNALTKGINNSSHMLVIVSLTTMKSNWVPFEIGYGYDKTNLSVLTLKGVNKNDIPDYIRTAKNIRDIRGLNFLIGSLRDASRKTLLYGNSIEDYKNSYHPLSNYMDTYN